MIRRQRVALPTIAYDVVLAPDFDGLGDALRALWPAAARVALVTDDHVGPLFGDAVAQALAAVGLNALRVTLPAGEAHKTLDTYASCVSALLAHGVDRRTPVVALGGGVVGDIAGFAAATVLRGVPLVQVPTTLLAMVDSSVGGKTGVNHPLGKNLVGAFHQPSLVWAATHTLRSLPTAELVGAYGEVLKSAVIGDPALLDALAAGDVPVDVVVGRCVAVKADVVARDEREAGLRAVLNLGHTAGHGLEAALGYGVMPHGAAVALGMLAAARFASRIGVLRDAGLPRRLHGLCRAIGLPTEAPPFDRDRALSAMRLDKKAFGDTIILALPVCPGDVQLVPRPISDLATLLSEIP